MHGVVGWSRQESKGEARRSTRPNGSGRQVETEMGGAGRVRGKVRQEERQGVAEESRKEKAEAGHGRQRKG